MSSSLLLKQPFFASFIPLLIGLIGGLFIISDPYLAEMLGLSHTKLLHLPLPHYTVGLLLFLGILSIPWLLAFSGWFWEKKEILFIWFLFVSAEIRSITSLGRLDLSDLVVGFFFVVWFLSHFLDESKKVTISPITYLLLAYLLAALLSMTNKGQVGGIITLIKVSLAVFLLVDTIRTEKLLYQAIKGFLIVATISAIAGILQEVLYLITGVLYIGNVDAVTRALMFQGPLLRVPAFFGIPQALANILVISWSMTYFLLLSNIRKPFKNRLLMVFMLLLMTTALILTFSRGAWLAVLIALILGIYFKKPEMFLQTTIFFAVLVLISYYSGVLQIAWEEIYYRMGSGDVADRIRLMQDSITGMWHQYPWLGIGIYSGYIYTANPFHWPAHNIFLRALVETGILGGIIFIGIFAYLFFRLAISQLSSSQRESKILLKSFILALIALSINVSFDPLLFGDFWLFLALAQATILVYKKRVYVNPGN